MSEGVEEIFVIAEESDVGIAECDDNGSGDKPNDGKCYANSDCPENYMCDNKQCVKL